MKNKKAISPLERTGERYIPEMKGGIALEHLHRYAMACQFAKDKNVLDIASGEGYGSAMLAKVANHVIGVDISEEAISFATGKYSRDNLEFKVGSCAEIPLKDASLDLIVSFETIEHHDQHEAMLKEFKRVLHPNGVLIISSPDKYEYSDMPNYSNPFHVKELYRNEFESLVSKYFENMQIYGQRVIYGSGIFIEKASASYVNFSEDGEVININDGLFRPVYNIVVASNNDLPEAVSGVFELPVWQSDVAKSLVRERDQAVEQSNIAMAEQDETIKGLNAELAERDETIKGLNAELAERDETVNGLTMQLAEQDEAVNELNVKLTEQHKAVKELSTKLAEQDETVDGLTTQLTEQDETVDGLTTQLAERYKTIKGLTAQLAERDETVKGLNAELAERDETINGLTMQLAERYKTIKGLNAELAERDETIKGLNAELAERDETINGLTMQLAERDEENKRLMTEVTELRQSTSWKLTAPLRCCSSGVRNGARGMREVAVSILRPVYHLLPFSSSRKNRIKGWCYSKLPFLFRHTLSYCLWTKLPQSGLPQVIVPTNMPVDLAKELNFHNYPNPTVSIIIPVYGEIEYTQHCILWISNIDSRISYEIIVVDDCSPDDKGDVLERIDGIRVVHNDRNLGFIRSCNRGSELALGEYLLFLSNKTKVMPGWLDEFVWTFYQKPNAGLVGSKLISTDGSLQEAGNIIWRDGSNWNYGRKDNPDRPKYNYLRDVDYCSAVSIMVPRKLFHDKGCFTDGYGQTYYAAAELAFTIRAAGYRVLYQPLSQVIHYEKINTVTDFNADGKACKVENEKKFREKWTDVLNTYRPNGVAPEYEKERSVAKRILIINDLTPTPDKDSGSVDLDSYLRIFLSFGYKITFISAADFLYLEDYSRDLQRIGVECLYKPFNTNVTSHLQERGEEYDVVMLYRAYYASQFIDEVKKYCKAASVIFNTVDLHYLRMERQAVIENSEVLKEEAARIKVIELSLMDKADKTIILSNAELDLLKSEGVDCGKIAVVPLIREIIGRKSGYEGRNGIVFVGGFKHAPNVDAMHYFSDEIWPLIKERIPEAEMYICGSHMPEEIRELDGNGIHTVGFVKDLAEFFNSCKLSVAPLRYGSGLKGKVGASLSYGLPCVATSLAIEGSGLIDGEHVLVEDTPIKFSEAVVRLYEDEVLWSSLSEAGLQFVTDIYSFDAGKRRIATMLSSLSS